MQLGVLESRCTAGALPLFSTLLSFLFSFLHIFFLSLSVFSPLLQFLVFVFRFCFLVWMSPSLSFFLSFYILSIFLPFLLFCHSIFSFIFSFLPSFPSFLHIFVPPSILSFLFFPSLAVGGGNGSALPPRGVLTRAAQRDAAPCPCDLWLPRCLLTAVCVSCLSAPGVGRGRCAPGGLSS